MSVIILSSGRTGTNIALEMLRDSKELNATINVHDERTVRKGNKVNSKWLSKADIDLLEWPEISRFLRSNPDMKIIFTVRHPYDTQMSKIYRGQPNSEGRGNWVAEDATPHGCFESMVYMKVICEKLKQQFADRLLIVKMEDMILETEETCKDMCDFVGIEYRPSMCEFYKRMRNTHKKKRYKKIDKSQVGLWKRIYEVYDGFFKDYKPNIEVLNENIMELLTYYDY